MNGDDDTPESMCPRCHAWQPDLDGFGVLKCDHCDYCQHPSTTPRPAGGWVCDLCSYTQPEATR